MKCNYIMFSSGQQSEKRAKTRLLKTIWVKVCLFFVENDGSDGQEILHL